MTEGQAETKPTPAEVAEAAFLAALGQRVRRMRAVRGMSRKVLARASGISERYIAQLESGQAMFPLFCCAAWQKPQGHSWKT